MSSERHLISKILLERDLTSASEAGVSAAFFLDTDHRAAFEAILDHQAEYSEVPTVEAFKKDFPTYRLSSAEDAMQYYVDEVVHEYKQFLLESGLSEAVDLYEDGNPDAAKSTIASTLDQLNREVAASRVTDITQTGADRVARYKVYARSKGALKGISTGFDAIDQATGGLQKKNLVTFVGPPKAGKSTIMLLAMMAAHRGFYRPLFIGFEMSNEEQEERHDAIRAEVSHKKLREGRLSMDEMRKLEKMARRLDSMPPMIFSEDANSTLTLSGVASQVQQHKPDVAFIDGVYMMDDEHGERKGSPQALTNITRGFKQMAKNFDIPFAISTQVLEWKMDRKKGVTSSSIGYSSSFIQDSDQIIAVERTEEPDVNKLKVVLGRNNPGMEVFVRWDWETGRFEELEEQDANPEEEYAGKF